MRKEFLAAISGWTLTSDVEDLGEYIEATISLAPYQPDEIKTLNLMVQTQINRGILRGDFEPFLSGEKDLLRS